MKKIFEKEKYNYENVSIEVRAAVWYSIGNIIQKMAPWLVMLILTHYLSTEQYGIYSVYVSWLEIFEIIITLRIYSNGYVAGLIKNDKNQNDYTAAMQTLSLLLVVVWLAMYIVFRQFINGFTGIGTALSVLMICSFIGTVSFGLWSSRQRVDNHYKIMFLATIVYGVLGSVISALSVFLNWNNPIMYVIIIKTLIQLFVSILFIASNYRGANMKWNSRYSVDAIRYNLPLMPYYLSMILLNHSDRLMIQKIDGYEEAALYSVSYSVAMIVFVISGALNLSLQAWLFKCLKNDTNGTDKTKLVNIGTIVVAFFIIVELSLAPECILILGGKKYLNAIWVIPPLALSVLVMFIYQQYVNVLFYYKKTKQILLVSIASAIINIGLNSVFISQYGYVAGGYTSLFSYSMVLILYYIFAKVECKKNHIIMKQYFNTRFQLFVLTLTAMIAFLMTLLYMSGCIRYVVVILLMVVFLGTREKWEMLMKKK